MTQIPDLSNDPKIRAGNACFVFHRLWRKGYDGPRYDKAEWIMLGKILVDAGIEVYGSNAEPPGPPYDPDK